MRSIDAEKIKAQAKGIMDDFVKALDRIKEVKEEFGAERKEATRKAGKSEFPGFRERALSNAPKRKDNYFLTEKKRW